MRQIKPTIAKWAAVIATVAQRVQLGVVPICCAVCAAINSMKSKVVTVSAISAALTAIALTLGAYIELVDLYAIVISSAFIILPTY